MNNLSAVIIKGSWAIDKPNTLQLLEKFEAIADLQFSILPAPIATPWDNNYEIEVLFLEKEDLDMTFILKTADSLGLLIKPTKPWNKRNVLYPLKSILTESLEKLREIN